MKYDVKYSKDRLIGSYVLSFLILAGTVIVYSILISSGHFNENTFDIFDLTIPIVINIALVLINIHCSKFKISVEDKKITVRKVFSTKEYYFEDLGPVYMGYRRHNNFSKTIVVLMTFKTPESFKKTKTINFDENMINWTLLADKLIQLGKLEKENGKYKDHFGY